MEPAHTHTQMCPLFLQSRVLGLSHLETVVGYVSSLCGGQALSVQGFLFFYFFYFLIFLLFLNLSRAWLLGK